MVWTAHCCGTCLQSDTAPAAGASSEELQPVRLHKQNPEPTSAAEFIGNAFNAASESPELRRAGVDGWNSPIKSA
jgi:hypothetical protein